MLIKLILTFIWLFYLYYRTKDALHMAQQNLYDDDRRYFKWIKKNFDRLMLGIELSQIFLIFFILFANNIIIMPIIFFLVYSILALRNYAINQMTIVKLKLVYTSRVKRIVNTMIFIYIVSLYIAYILNINYYIAISLLAYLQYFIILLAIKLNIPIEKSVFNSYKRQAQKKLMNMNDLKVVGITGSYGKTSSKNILNDILNVRYNSITTPKNLNTPYGLIMTINNNLGKFDEIFIAEMGAYKRGEIKELCDIVHPSYGILTRIGKAHLELFGSQENIQKTKFELIESLPSDGVAVLNKDDPLQVSYNLKNNVKILWIGIDNYADFMATNISVTNKGTSFDLKIAYYDQLFHFETKLLGYANIYNILAAIALGYEFEIPIKDLVSAVKRVEPVSHRLELKKNNDIYFLDDAYNSNPVGSKMALDVLKLMPGKKIVITPGMVELGSIEDEENMIFGENIADVCDDVILIGRNQTKSIYKGLKNKNYSDNHIYILEDVSEAFKLLDKLKDEETYVLLENDLPDMFK